MKVVENTGNKFKADILLTSRPNVKLGAPKQKPEASFLMV
jgi:hypothetical protein